MRIVIIKPQRNNVFEKFMVRKKEIRIGKLDLNKVIGILHDFS